MSKRDWINRPATLVFAVTLLVISLTYAGDKILEGWERVHEANAAYQKNAEADREKSADEIAKGCQNPDVIFRDCVRENLESHYKDQATNEDLQAQQDMAFWAFWLLIASVFGIFISAYGVVLLIRSISLGRDANTQAVKATEINAHFQRLQSLPYPYISSIKLDWREDHTIENEVKWISFDMNAVIENGGATPALDLFLHWKIVRFDMKMLLPERTRLGEAGTRMVHDVQPNAKSNFSWVASKPETFFTAGGVRLSDAMKLSRFMIIVKMEYSDFTGDRKEMFFESTSNFINGSEIVMGSVSKGLKEQF